MPLDEVVAGPTDWAVTGVSDGVVDDAVDDVAAESVVGTAELDTGAADDGVAAGDEEHPATASSRQPSVASLPAPQAVTATELARF